jgi:hypothetical protein
MLYKEERLQIDTNDRNEEELLLKVNKTMASTTIRELLMFQNDDAKEY